MNFNFIECCFYQIFHVVNKKNYYDNAETSEKRRSVVQIVKVEQLRHITKYQILSNQLLG